MRLAFPGTDAPRAAWIGYALGLAIFTIVYNLAEGLVSMGFGWADESMALFGFGADSFIEVGSALLVLWRLRGEGRGCQTTITARERRAALGIGILFLLLGAGTATGAGLQLRGHAHPSTTIPGVAISLLSLGFMVFLWRAKKRAATILNSRTLEGDAACSLACIQLSVVLLGGSLLFWLAPELWWVDAVAALVLSGFIAKEGLSIVSAVRKPGFSGGCDCH